MAAARHPLGLVRLMTWLSPAFPVGGFAYSGGLESAVVEGHVTGVTDLAVWIETLLHAGSLRNDVILLAEGYRACGDPVRLQETVALASALSATAERYHEATGQGDAFLAAASAWPQHVLSVLGPGTPYSVAVGAVAMANGIALGDTLAAFLQAQCGQLVSAAIRLGIIGQSHGVAILAGLEPAILQQARLTVDLGLDDLGSATVTADLLSMRHETQYSRLFQS
ncbi:urease accessory protein UreF [Ciceribacter naphthalenivorans]|uniref:urease accessory protein UreF n=1 Tax=Ciceribacter naphthalenivorans TaxID=1118451 RepID=UPI003530F72B